MDENKIDRIMEKHIHDAFEEVYVKIEAGTDTKPSEIARHLDRYWDLGDFYREWWETDDEGGRS